MTTSKPRDLRANPASVAKAADVLKRAAFTLMGKGVPHIAVLDAMLALWIELANLTFGHARTRERLRNAAIQNIGDRIGGA